MASHREEDNDLVVLKAGIDITSASAAACCCTKYYVTTVVEFQGYYEKHKGPLGTHCKYIRPDYDGTLAIHSSTIVLRTTSVVCTTMNG